MSWIRPLATPCLSGYSASAVTGGPLHGYRFVVPGKGLAKSSAGFFVGYLLEAEGYEFLRPVVPECIVLAIVEPVGSEFHEAMVARGESPVRKAAEYLGRLTPRPPRFSFFEHREIVMARHVSMKDWPAGKQQQYARDFFTGTLAWLLSSGIIAKLQPVSGAKAESNSP
jgi:hypothetical protein